MDFMGRIRTRAQARRTGSYLGARLGKTECFVQGDQNIANQAGAAFRSDLNNELQALVTLSSGTAAPGTTYAHQLWADTTNNLLKKRNAANSGWIVVRTLDEAFVLSRSTNTILAGSDVGKTIVATAGFTQTFTAAATLGDGWWVAYRVESGATLVFDPNASENIDGATTKSVVGPASGFIFCNNAAFFTVGFGAAALADRFILDASVASNALTLTLKAGSSVNVRSGTVGSGSLTNYQINADTSLVISSGSTMGFANATAGRLWLVAFDDAGTLRLGAVNCVASNNIMPLASYLTANSTAEGGAGAADNAQTFYTGTAVTGKAYAVLGSFSWETGLTTAGTWNAAPTRIESSTTNPMRPGDSIQRVWSTNQSGSTISSSTVADVTNGSISIQPTSACNAVLFEASWDATHNNSSATNDTSYLQLVRGSTTISATDAYDLWYSSTGGGGSVAAAGQAAIMDFPHSSSSTTYKLQHRIAGANSPSRTTTNMNLFATEIVG